MIFETGSFFFVFRHHFDFPAQFVRGLTLAADLLD